MDKYENSKVNTKRYKKLKKLLAAVYGYDSFKPKQYEIINKIISGEDVCAVLPTGYGKSLTFQVPALYIDKPAIIISPLISLMDDQRMILEKLGISSCCINSNVANKSELKNDIFALKYKFIYITPETASKSEMFFKNLYDKRGISLIAIDECHCISSYGHSFRPEYRKLTMFREIVPEVPILAVTATATSTASKDICKVLGINCDNIIKTSFDRPNLYLDVRLKSSKRDFVNPGISTDIVPIINQHKNSPIIIYCLTRKETKEMAQVLKVHKINCGIYHAGLSQEDKTKSHNDFIDGKVKVMAATIAFGMGINKSDVRVVIHYGIPKNLEGYYQEIGRAGRDGLNAYCYCFHSAKDSIVQESLIRRGNDSQTIENELKLFSQMKKYVATKSCRRQLLLEYFDEEYPDKCNNCDNCCNTDKTISGGVKKTTQNIQKEARDLILLIESIKGRTFGLGMYINILRGSCAKSITSQMKKNDLYGKGKHRSVNWWKEMSDHLIDRGFLKYKTISGKFGVQVIGVTSEGLTWANAQLLSNILDCVDNIKLDPVQMSTVI